MEKRLVELSKIIKGYDPIELSEKIEHRICDNNKRKYYRFRGGRFYGGIATGDVVGCNLRCIFCWTGRARDDLNIGYYVDPETSFKKLTSIATRNNYKYIRLSGGEPTLCSTHLLELARIINDNTKYIFILETNGILLAKRHAIVKELAKLENIHVRLSIKACNPSYFKALTGAKEEAFYLQLKAAETLFDNGTSFHIAIFASFGEESCWKDLLEELISITDKQVVENIEVEYLIMYKHVAQKLSRLGIKPRISYKPW